MTDRHHDSLTTALRNPGQPGSIATSGAALIFAILALAITLSSLVDAVIFSGMPLTDDAGLLLDCARLIIHGWLPYVEFADINPPMTHYIHVLPVYLARILKLEIPTAFSINNPFAKKIMSLTPLTQTNGIDNQ